MSQKIVDRCKSCGLPIVPGKLEPGTGEGGLQYNSYCELCLQNGKLLNEGKSPEEMVEMATRAYIEHFGWKNEKNACAEAKSGLRMAKVSQNTPKPLNRNVRLIIIVIGAIILALLSRLLKIR